MILFYILIINTAPLDMCLFVTKKPLKSTYESYTQVHIPRNVWMRNEQLCFVFKFTVNKWMKNGFKCFLLYYFFAFYCVIDQKDRNWNELEIISDFILI